VIAATPSPPKPVSVGIQIHWPKATGASIKILLVGDTPTSAGKLSSPPSRWQGHAAQSALDALDRMIAAARQERRAV